MKTAPLSSITKDQYFKDPEINTKPNTESTGSAKL